ncbi:MAG TPA: BtrH N-terminal domain-containing protein [Terracidiphilus sp.]|nr:BtrH N-terminal domain-containing protein [Terracidiphilus sp.]
MPAHALSVELQPFRNCPALDGCHCVTNSMAKMFHHAGREISEEMLFGLGAGIGFVYWQMNFGGETSVFIGGRANLKNFSADLGRRTGARIVEMRSGSAKKAEDVLVRALEQQQPMMLGGDMGFLPWCEFPPGYHFGGHTFVACGYDGHDTVLCSDMEPKAAGVKKGLYAPISLAQLRKARGSTFKPFPPKNLWFEFDFAHFRAPHARAISEAIAQAADAQLHPPIKNLGVSGMRHAAAQLPQWPSLFNDFQLRVNLFNLYIFIEIGGTGGGAFRAMYARFLDEAATIAKKPLLAEIAEEFRESARRFTAIALLFKDAEKTGGLDEKIQAAAAGFREIADREQRAWSRLAGAA